MTRFAAILPIDPDRTPLGLPSLVDAPFGDTTVLGRTLARLGRCRHLNDVVLVHPAHRDPGPALGGGEPTRMIAVDGPLWDVYHPRRCSARKWALHAWRGGLAGATCFDEGLAPEPMVSAARAVGADAVLVAGPDWPCIDPLLCDRIMACHAEAPEAHRITFSQAPPGLAGVVIATDLLEEMSQRGDCTIGRLLDYVPSHPQPDPIGRDMCVAIDPGVRDIRHRFIFDTPRSAALLSAVDDVLGTRGLAAEATAIVTAAASHATDVANRFGPREVTLELTPRRAAGIGGTLVPQAHVALPRAVMPADEACRLVEQIAGAGDVVLTLGGLGDALEHEAWLQVVETAHDAGVFGIALETDLACDAPTVETLIDAPIDVLSVRLNADTAAVYAEVMADATADHRALFARTTKNLERFLNESRRRATRGIHATPWLVPRLVKSRATLTDMESFFDRWVHYGGHAVIEPVKPGRSDTGPLMPDGGLPPMAPPRRTPCRQVEHRLTVLSDGQVAQCDQDWLATRPLGDATSQPLSAIWADAAGFRAAHAEGQWNESPLCTECQLWNRP